jgi:hypothetical protein
MKMGCQGFSIAGPRALLSLRGEDCRNRPLRRRQPSIRTRHRPRLRCTEPGPNGSLGSRPTGQQGVTGSIVDAQLGSVTYHADRNRPAGFGVSRYCRVTV